jgi:hypothetical protein
LKLNKFALSCLCLLLAMSFIAEGSTVAAPAIDIRLFDQYGDINAETEMARLDFIALQLQKEPGVVAHFIVYGGRRSCKGEAQARAWRAKDYLVNTRGISFDRVIWRDGGYREELTVEVYLSPRASAEPPVAPTILPRDVQIKKRCKGRKTNQRRESLQLGKR